MPLSTGAKAMEDESRCPDLDRKMPSSLQNINHSSHMVAGEKTFATRIKAAINDGENKHDGKHTQTPPLAITKIKTRTSKAWTKSTSGDTTPTGSVDNSALAENAYEEERGIELGTEVESKMEIEGIIAGKSDTAGVMEDKKSIKYETGAAENAGTEGESAGVEERVEDKVAIEGEASCKAEMELPISPTSSDFENALAHARKLPNKEKVLLTRKIYMKANEIYQRAEEKERMSFWSRYDMEMPGVFRYDESKKTEKVTSPSEGKPEAHAEFGDEESVGVNEMDRSEGQDDYKSKNKEREKKREKKKALAAVFCFFLILVCLPICIASLTTLGPWYMRGPEPIQAALSHHECKYRSLTTPEHRKNAVMPSFFELDPGTTQHIHNSYSLGNIGAASQGQVLGFAGAWLERSINDLLLCQLRLEALVLSDRTETNLLPLNHLNRHRIALDDIRNSFVSHSQTMKLSVELDEAMVAMATGKWQWWRRGHMKGAVADISDSLVGLNQKEKCGGDISSRLAILCAHLEALNQSIQGIEDASATMWISIAINELARAAYLLDEAEDQRWLSLKVVLAFLDDISPQKRKNAIAALTSLRQMWDING